MPANAIFEAAKAYVKAWDARHPIVDDALKAMSGSNSQKQSDMDIYVSNLHKTYITSETHFLPGHPQTIPADNAEAVRVAYRNIAEKHGRLAVTMLGAGIREARSNFINEIDVRYAQPSSQKKPEFTEQLFLELIKKAGIDMELIKNAEPLPDGSKVQLPAGVSGGQHLAAANELPTSASITNNSSAPRQII